MRFKRRIYRIEYYDLEKRKYNKEIEKKFKNISNPEVLSEMYLADQFCKVVEVRRGTRLILKQIIAWGYDGWDPNKLIEFLLADYVHNKKYSPYDCKEMCI